MLAAVLNVPRAPDDWPNWTFNYQAVVHAIDSRLGDLGVSVPQYQLDPLPGNDVENWLERVQQSHNDFNSAIGLQGSDLSSVDITDPRQLEAWIWLIYLELNTATIALGIGP